MPRTGQRFPLSRGHAHLRGHATTSQPHRPCCREHVPLPRSRCSGNPRSRWEGALWECASNLPSQGLSPPAPFVPEDHRHVWKTAFAGIHNSGTETRMLFYFGPMSSHYCPCRRTCIHSCGTGTKAGWVVRVHGRSTAGQQSCSQHTVRLSATTHQRPSGRPLLHIPPPSQVPKHPLPVGWALARLSFYKAARILHPVRSPCLFPGFPRRTTSSSCTLAVRCMQSDSSKPHRYMRCCQARMAPLRLQTVPAA